MPKTWNPFSAIRNYLIARIQESEAREQRLTRALEDVARLIHETYPPVMGPSGGQIIDELIPMLNEAVTTQTIDEETVGALLELQSGAAEHAEKRTGKVTKKQMVEIIKLARTYEVQPRCYIGHQWDKEKIKEGRERLEKAFENL